MAPFLIGHHDAKLSCNHRVKAEEKVTAMKSGEFAKICGTTKNTLLHYDQIGLLTPSSVRPTGYRDYSVSDAIRFFAIRAFVDAGFSLTVIKGLMADKSVEDLRAIANETREAISARKQELERSAEVLDELVRQMGSLAEREQRAGRSVCYEKAMPEQTLFVASKNLNMRPGDSFDALCGDLEKAMVGLSSFGAEGLLAPYGFTSRMCADGPIYDKAYFLLPTNERQPRLAKTPHVDGDLAIDVRPGGRYLCYDYDGIWPHIASAYKTLLQGAEDRSLALEGPFYETSAFRFFDEDEEAVYRCTIAVRIEDGPARSRAIRT